MLPIYIRNNTYVYNIGLQPSCNSIALELRSNGAGAFVTDGFDGNAVDCVATVYEAWSGMKPAAWSSLESPFEAPLLLDAPKPDEQLPISSKDKQMNST